MNAWFQKYLPVIARAIVTGMIPSATAAGIGVVVYALLKRSMPPTQVVSLIIALTLFSVCFTLFLYSLFRDDRLMFESNWGGLGGGLSGWRVSPSIVFLLLSIGSLALLVVALGPPRPDPRERYRAALNLAAQKGIKLDTQVVGGKLIVKGTAPQADLNAFWDQVKLANAMPDDFEAQLEVRPVQQPAGGGHGGSNTVSEGAPPSGTTAEHPNSGAPTERSKPGR